MAVILPQSSQAAACLTKTEAQKKWPSSHLYWHTDAKCWDDQAATKASRDKYEPRPHRRQHDDSPPLPDTIPERTKPIITEAERPAPNAPPAEIAFPTLSHSEYIARPSFTFLRPLPWFSPYPMTGWPQIYDVDEPDKFTAWRKRIE